LFGNSEETGDKGEGLLPGRLGVAMVQAFERDLRIGWEIIAEMFDEGEEGQFYNIRLFKILIRLGSSRVKARG